MTVKELRGILDTMPETAEVILSKDSEGNSFSPLHAVSTDAIYVPNSTWEGEVYHAEWSADDADMDEDEWAEMLKRPRCLVLWPTN